jgi:Zn-dependent protease/predicted transcriptional regulator
MSGFRIFTIRGIPIRLHWSFLIVLPFLAFAFSRTFRTAALVADVPPEQLVGTPILWGLGVALALFASVLVHELAHSLYALRKGGRVRGITLLMVGGISEIAEPPEKARQEAMMALVGPLVSLALGGLFFLVHAVAERASFNLRFAFFYLGSLNVFLGVFNLLPAFPMDGGRILRALLTDRMGAVRATNVASRVGKVFAILFGAWGLLSFNMFLVLIAFFVFMGAEAETRSVMVRALLGRLHVGDMMQRGILMLPADVSVDTAAERMLRERTMAYAVMEGAQLIGVVTLDDVQKVPVDQRGGVPVRAIVTQVQPVSPSDDATTALRLMTERDLPVLAVVEGGLVVGTVSRDDIGRTLKLSELEATQQANHHRVPRPVMP